MRSWKSKLVSCAMSVVLVAGLCPVAALADNDVIHSQSFQSASLADVRQLNLEDAPAISLKHGSISDFALLEDGSLWELPETGEDAIRIFENAAAVFPDNYSSSDCGLLVLDSAGTLWERESDGDILGGNRKLEKVMENVATACIEEGARFALDSDGSLWAWGNNGSGQLGTGDTDEVATPVEVMKGVKSIATDGETTYAIKSNSTLWAWGRGDGRLGDGGAVDRLEPVEIMSDVASISIDGSGRYAVKIDGALWAWGGDDYWCVCGDGRTGVVSSPTQILSDVASVAHYSCSTAVIKADGSAWSWGGCNSNQDEMQKVMPSGATDVSVGETSLYVLDDAGCLWACGGNEYGQLGDGTVTSHEQLIKVSEGISSVLPAHSGAYAVTTAGSVLYWGVSAAAGDITPSVVLNKAVECYSIDDSTFAIDSDGKLWAWGKNRYGVLGDGTDSFRRSPVRVLDDVAMFRSDGWTSLAVKKDGSLWAWGQNEGGTLGDGTDETKFQPVKVIEDGVQSVYIHGGGIWGTAYVLKDDGSLWGWGSNLSYVPGEADAYAALTPHKIMDDVAKFYTDAESLFAIRTDGSLWGWGYNRNGEIGDAYDDVEGVPVRILDNVSSFYSGGEGSSFALRSDGTLWSWGCGRYGMLGNGSDEDQGEPTKIMDDVESFVSDSWVSHAIKTDKSLWTWGDVLHEGDYGSSYVTEPVQILSDVVSVHPDFNVSFALASDNSLWGWGSDFYGELGLGDDERHVDDVDYSSPIKLMDDVSDFFTAITRYGTTSFSYAVKKDGTSWAWGDDWYGWLVGDAEYSDSLHEQREPIKFLSNLSRIVTNGASKFAIDKSGNLWSWGDNTFGQLGNGTSTVSLPHELAFAAIDISKALVTISDQTYTGKDIKPKPTVEYGDADLEEGTDYVLSYKNNTNAGTATVVIEGKGTYTGTLEKTFTIKQAPLSSITLKATSATYDAKSHKPTVKAVKAASNSITVASSNYSVSYLRGSKATTDFKTGGTITVKATAKSSSNFTGSKTVSFKINQAVNPMKPKVTTKTVRLAKGKKKLAKATTVSGAIAFTKKGQGTITYAKVAKGSSKYLTVAKKTGKITVAKNTPKGSYKIKVNVTAAGNSNYKKLTKQVTATIKVS